MTEPVTPPWIYDASLVRVIDGDTVVLTLRRTTCLDFGFRFRSEMTLTSEGAFRILGIDTPEKNSKFAEEVRLAHKATEKVAELLTHGTLSVASHKPPPSDKYGRWLVEIKVTQPNGQILDVAAELIAVGLALPYNGKGPKPSWG